MAIYNLDEMEEIYFNSQLLEEVYFNGVLVWELNKIPQRYDATPLSVARGRVAATTIGNYALFGGGSLEEGCTSSVNAYDSSLTRSIPTALSVARSYLAATTIGNYALFGGGNDTNFNPISSVNAYNSSLTRSTPTALSVARSSLAATTIGNYALFGGGDASKPDEETKCTSSVNAYDSSLTRSTPTALSVARKYLAATTIGNYALFGGGDDNSHSISSVDAYNSSLTRSTPTALSVARRYLAATTIGNYALFGGGKIKEEEENYELPVTSSVDAYNSSLTRSTPTALSVARSSLAATTIGNYALFGGGNTTNTGYSFSSTSSVDAYDGSLTRSTPTALSVARQNIAATTIGNYALFGGGNNGISNAKTTVDAYK